MPDFGLQAQPLTSLACDIPSPVYDLPSPAMTFQALPLTSQTLSLTLKAPHLAFNARLWPSMPLSFEAHF